MSDIVIKGKGYLLLGRQGNPGYSDKLGIYFRHISDSGKIYLVFLHRNTMDGWNLVPVQQYKKNEYTFDPYFSKYFNPKIVHSFSSQWEIEHIVSKAEIEIEGVPV